MAAKTAAQKAADKKAKEAADLAAGTPEAAPEAPVVDEAAELDKAIDAETAAPEGVKTGKDTSVDGVVVLEDKKTGVKTIKPTGRFVSVGNLIFNEFGQHCGTEDDESIAARKTGSFNTQRKFR